MNNDQIEKIEQSLHDAAVRGIPCAPIADRVRDAAAGTDLVAAAYAVQQRSTSRRLAAGERLIGRKIGLTATAVQRQLGVDMPDFGMLFDSMKVADGETIAMGRTHQPKVEAEIALVLARDLVLEKHDPAHILAATAFALPAIEVVGSRIADWKISLLDTIADNASSGLFVLGNTPIAPTGVDFVDCKMVMKKGEEIVSSGRGADCLGSPLAAAAWLADVMVRVGSPLRAGDILMTGALGPMVSVQAGARFTAHIDGLGEVSVNFGPDEQ